MASSNDNRFLGKVAIVTGSSSGIGEAIALGMATLGGSVTLCGRNLERLEAVRVQCIERSGGHAERFLAVPGDVMDANYRSDLVDKTVEKFGKLDILVCNAGGSQGNGSLEKATEEVFDNFTGIYLKSVFFLIQKAAPHLEKSKGNIVNISSAISKMASSPMIIYAVTRAALDHMTRCLALDLAPKGIRVNSINPSFTVTRVFRGGASEEDSRATLEKIAAKEVENQPLGNRLVTVDELAQGVFYLASDQASFVTGQNLLIDGGRALAGPSVRK